MSDELRQRFAHTRIQHFAHPPSNAAFEYTLVHIYSLMSPTWGIWNANSTDSNPITSNLQLLIII